MREDKKKRNRVTRRSGTGIGNGASEWERERDAARDADYDRRAGRDDRDVYRTFERGGREDRRSDYRDDLRDDYRDERRSDYRDERRSDYRDERRNDYRDERRSNYRDERRNDYRDERRAHARDEHRENHDDRRAPRTQEKQEKSARTGARGGADPNRTVHQLVPYALLCLAPFAAVSFVLRDIYGLSGSTGAFGNFLADFLCGLFGIAAYIVPLFMLVLALRWRKLVVSGKLAKKLFLSTSFVLLLSGIIHVFQESPQTRGVLDTAARTLYSTGVIRTGGGFFGGFVGEWMGYILRLPGTIILGIPLLLIVSIYLVGLTPNGVWERIVSRVKLIRDRREERRRALFDGEEAPRKRIKEAAAAQKGKGAPVADDTNWRQPRPIEPISMDGEEHFVFSEEEDEVLKPIRPQATPEQEDADRVRPMSDFCVFEDEPDEAIMKEQPAPIPTPAPTAPDPEVVLRAIPREQPIDPPTPTPAPKDEGEVYAPFALPVRPFPKREEKRAATPHAAAPVEQAVYQRASAPASPMSSVFEEDLGTPMRRPATMPSFEMGSSTPTYASPVNEEDVLPFAPAQAQTSAAIGEEIFTAAPAQRDAAPTQGVRVSPFGTELFENEKETLPEQEDFVKQPSARSFVEDPFDLPIAQEEPPAEQSAPAAPFAAFAEELPVDDGEDVELDMTAQEEDKNDEEEEDETLFTPAAPTPAPETKTFVFAPEREKDAPSSRKPVTLGFDRHAPAPQLKVKTERILPDPVPEPEPIAKEYVYPTVALLNEDTNRKGTDHSEEIEEKIAVLRQTLADFNIRVKDQVDCSRGPTITRYELRPEAGVSVRSVINRIDDISLNMAAPVRIEAPIPGKPAIGIEVPNAARETVFMRTVLESEAFRNSKKPLEIPLGLGIGGDVQMCNLAAMPHLLVAGTTGSGKSVCINTILIGLMYKTSPRDLRLILIDPKQIEFAPYEHVPHLYMPIVTDMQRAAGALACAVQEMERRYSLIRDVGVRDIDSYNEAVKNDPEREHLPRIVIVIDEFADLKMSCANNDPENFTCRLAQKARAAGIHLIIGTQRPSVDVITGKLKNNIPSRIAFTVMQQVDSRTILDMNGAESLIGKGDMLYMPTGSPKPARVQGAFVSDGELERVVSYVRKNNDPVRYNQAFMDQIEAEMAKAANTGKKDDYDDMEDEGGEDPKFVEAVELAISTQKVATSLLQRRLGVGYGRAAKIIDRMEELGLVSEAEGNKPRKLLPAAQGYLDHIRGGEDDAEEYDEDYN